MIHLRMLPKYIIRLALSAVLLMAWPDVSSAQNRCDSSRIEHVDKIGVGTWPVHGRTRMIADLEQLQAQWFYDWAFQDDVSSRYVPMIWGARSKGERQVPALLAFNEPDQDLQSRMTVNEAIRMWPLLTRIGARVSSPATSQGQTLGRDSWQERFMRRVDALGYRVDFMAVHYHSTDGDVDAFRDFLDQVHARYRRPIWVTEWALADWTDRGRFTVTKQRRFFERGARMLDDLAYVERHAWFGTYAELDSSHIASELVDPGGRLTPIGDAFRKLVQEGATYLAQCPDVR